MSNDSFSKKGNSSSMGLLGGVTKRVSVHLVASYPVSWTKFAVLRDFLQNFFDAKPPTDFHRGVVISRKAGASLIEMSGDGFAVDWLMHIGASTKTSSASGSFAGYFGEGFKIAALCSLRDFGWGVSMGSRSWSARVIFAPEEVDGCILQVMNYDVYSSNPRSGMTWLRLEGTSEQTLSL